jgi:hypothetical protein
MSSYDRLEFFDGRKEARETMLRAACWRKLPRTVHVGPNDRNVDGLSRLARRESLAQAASSGPSRGRWTNKVHRDDSLQMRYDLCMGLGAWEPVDPQDMVCDGPAEEGAPVLITAETSPLHGFLHFGAPALCTERSARGTDATASVLTPCGARSDSPRRRQRVGVVLARQQ